MCRCVVVLLLLIQPLIVQAQGTVTEVIPLGYRSLYEMAPIVQPLVGPGGSVSGLRDQMVVTTTPARMAEIRKVLQKLDASPERLVISVRRNSDVQSKQRSAAIHGQVGNVGVGGGGVSIGNTPTGHKNEGDHVRIIAADHSRDDDQGIQQRVQVLEGREAFISAGRDLPVRSRGIAYDTVGYYPARTGFFVVPRLNGDEVFLELSAQSRQAPTVGRRDYGRQPIEVNNVTTTIAGRLGEWIEISGTGGSETNSARGIGQRNKQQLEADSTIEVKVEKIQEFK